MNSIKKARQIFSSSNISDKPNKDDAKRLAAKAGKKNDKDFVSMLKLTINKAYLVGQEEAMLTSSSKDKTYMIALISMLLNGIVLLMFINQFYM